jgi:RNA polymerase sigma-70 factor (ECF subfamily)
LARRCTTDPIEAEDIAQEALLRAWRHRGSQRGDERLGGWLATIVRNEAARHHARTRPEPVAEGEARGGVEDERVLAAPLRVDLASALSRLEPEERLLLRLRYVRDLTQAAIARGLDVPEGTVKVRLHRARAKLHRVLEEA